MNKDPLNIDSVWTRQIESGQQPSGEDLTRAPFSQYMIIIQVLRKQLAWNCRDD